MRKGTDRRERIDEPGMAHHVIQTSLEERPLFRDPKVRIWFTRRVGLIAREERAIVFVRAIMDTHIHLLVWIAVSLERFMRRLGTSFALYFNSKHGREGRVFGETYWNTPILSPLQFRNTARYVSLNPFEARIVGRIDDLRSCDRTSVPALLGLAEPVCEDVDATLRFFGKTRQEARHELMEWLKRGNEGFDPYSDPPTDEDLRLDLLGSAELQRAMARQERRAVLVTEWTLDRIGLLACETFGASIDELLAGSKEGRVVAARALVSHLGVTELGLPASHVAEWLAVSPAAVLRGLPKGKRLAEYRRVKLSAVGDEDDFPRTP